MDVRVPIRNCSIKPTYFYAERCTCTCSTHGGNEADTSHLNDEIGSPSLFSVALYVDEVFRELRAIDLAGLSHSIALQVGRSKAIDNRVIT